MVVDNRQKWGKTRKILPYTDYASRKERERERKRKQKKIWQSIRNIISKSNQRTRSDGNNYKKCVCVYSIVVSAIFPPSLSCTFVASQNWRRKKERKSGVCLFCDALKEERYRKRERKRHCQNDTAVMRWWLLGDGLGDVMMCLCWWWTFAKAWERERSFLVGLVVSRHVIRKAFFIESSFTWYCDLLSAIFVLGWLAVLFCGCSWSL